MYEWLVTYWMEALFGVVCTMLAAAYRRLASKLSQRSAEEAAMKEGLLAILHDRLYAECTRCITADSITVEELRNVEYLYTAYHALGGNGTGTELYHRTRALRLCEE